MADPGVTGQVQLTPDEQTQLSESTLNVPLTSAITTATTTAPTLDPSTVLAIAQAGGDVPGNAQAVAQAQGTASTAAAVNRVSQQQGGGSMGGLFGFIANDIVHPVEKTLAPVGRFIKAVGSTTGLTHDVGDVLSALNQPLNFVQHEYRYLHDVEARHGYLAAILEATAMTVGAAAGTVLEPGEGTVLGAAAGTALMGQIAYNDSWSRTTDGNKYRDPNTGNVVSFGRDLAGAIMGQPKKGQAPSGAFGTLSGVVDGIGDLIADPLGVAGKLYGGAKSAEGLDGLLGKKWIGTALDSETIDQSYNTYRSVKRAIGQIAEHDGGWIVLHYPKLTPIADELGKAETPEEVLQVFKDISETNKLVTTDRLPSMTFAHSTAQQMADAIANYSGPMAEAPFIGPARMARAFSTLPGNRYDPALRDFKGYKMDFDSGDGAGEIIKAVTYSQNRQVAERVAQSWLYASPADRVQIYRNVVMDNVAYTAMREGLKPTKLAANAVLRNVPFTKMGKTVSRDIADYRELTLAPARKYLKTELDRLTGGGDMGHSGEYGSRLDGGTTRPVIDPTNDLSYQVALLENQTGEAIMPSLTQIKRMAANLRGARDLTGHLDDWAYGSATQGFFKPLVLLNVAYATHIILSEVIPNALRLGIRNMGKAAVAAAIGKAKYALDERDVEPMGAFLYRAFEGIPHSKEQVEAAGKFMALFDGHLQTAGASASHAYSKEIAPGARTEDFIRSVVERTPLRMRADARRFTRVSPDSPGVTKESYVRDWVDAFREASFSPASRAGAEAYLKGKRLQAQYQRPTEDMLDLPDIPDAPFYHGTRHQWVDNEIDQEHQGSTLHNLFGPGLYATDDKRIGTSYMEKFDPTSQGEEEMFPGERALLGAEYNLDNITPHVYGLEHTLGREPHWLPLEHALPDDAREMFTDHLSQLDPDGEISGWKVLNNESPGEEWVTALKEAVEHTAYRESKSGSTEEIDGIATPMMEEIHRELHQMGYDGYHYEGGGHVGSEYGAHNAYVVFRDSVTGDYPMQTVHHTAVTPEQREANERLIHERGATDEEIRGVADSAATIQLRKMPEEKRDMFLRSKLYTHSDPPWGYKPIDNWGHDITENALSLTGKNVDERLLEMMSNGQTPSPQWIMANMPPEEWPQSVKGRLQVPNGSSRVQRIADLGFRKILNPMINTFSRIPTFQAEYWRQYKLVKPMVDRGVLSDEDAVYLAGHRASTHMMKFVHNLHDRSQWTETFRNWMPFGFAQEQAYKRMGRFMAEDPGGFRRYQMMIAGWAQAAHQSNGSNGADQFSFPGGTFIGNGVTDVFRSMGVPLTNVDVSGGFNLNASSANVIFPLSSGFRPDASPIATFAAKGIQHLFPELTPELTAGIGSAPLSAGILSELIPNTTVARLVTAAGVGSPSRGMASSMMQIIQLDMLRQQEATARWVKGGQKGPAPEIVPSQQDAADPNKMQKYIDHVTNQARVLYFTNAFLGFFSPLSPSVKIEDLGLPEELQADINKVGVSKGMTEFLMKNPDASAYTVFQSQTTEGGTLPDSAEAEAWINTNRGLIDAFPSAALYLMPKVSDKYDPTIYNEQIAQGLRIKRTPTQFATEAYVAAGNQLYYNGLAQHEANLKGTVNKQAEYDNWAAWKNQLAAAMPVWAANGPLSNQKVVRAQVAISQFQQMAANNLFPDNPESQSVLTILQGFEQANLQYIQAGDTYNYSHAQTVVREGWQSYLKGIEAGHPELTNVINSVFLDSLGQVAPNG